MVNVNDKVQVQGTEGVFVVVSLSDTEVTLRPFRRGRFKPLTVSSNLVTAYVAPTATVQAA